MIDPNVLTHEPDKVKQHLDRRNADDSLYSSVDEVVKLEWKRRLMIQERDHLRAERNTLSKQIGGLMREGKKDEAEDIKATVATGKVRTEELETKLAELEAVKSDVLLSLPNLLHDEVPPGKGEDENLEIRRWGEPPAIPDPKPHVEVGEGLGLLDLERSAKLCGARFAVMRGGLAKLERSLVNWFLDVHTQENGYTELMVPYMVHRDVMVGTGQLPKFEHDMFRLANPVNGADAFLIPTAEVPVTNLHRDEILDDGELPLRYCAFTPCFRAEAGSAGADVRGLIRQHQFHKVEMVHVVHPERSEAEHERLLNNAETLLQRLGLHYRVVLLCGGDTSFAAHKCYDLEVWLPSQGRFREISSCSNFGDFQARRMGMRFRPAPVDGKKQKPRFPHTLNGSGLAVGRTVVAILENFQQPDGSVVIPEVLRPYMRCEVLRPAGE